MSDPPPITSDEKQAARDAILRKAILHEAAGDARAFSTGAEAADWLRRKAEGACGNPS